MNDGIIGTRIRTYPPAEVTRVASTEVDPRSGDVLWRYEPTTWKAPPLIQPRVLADDGSLGGGLLGGGLLVATGDGHGLARIDVRRDARGACSFDEVWTSRRLRPSFNDFVVHEGHVYGFSQHVFASLDAADGSRNWTLGRYGFGQALLLARSDAILLVSETGDLVLAAADPEEPRELGRVAALSGKTWNHPIVVGNRLFLRNGEEAVAYQLALAPAVSKSRD